MTKKIKTNERLIVALDVPSAEQAKDLVNKLGDAVVFCANQQPAHNCIDLCKNACIEPIHICPLCKAKSELDKSNKSAKYVRCAMQSVLDSSMHSTPSNLVWTKL